MLQLNDFSVPVKAYPAIASPESHLHQVHVGCGRRVSSYKFCSEHGTLESSEIGKAFAYSSDALVELSDDELAQLIPVDDKSIVIERCFSPEQFDLSLLAGRTMFLVPANLAAQHSFHLLKEALNQKEVWVLGRTVLSQKRQLVVIHCHDEIMLLHTLHDPALRRLPAPCHPSGNAPSRSEVRKFARAMVGRGMPISWMEYRDDSQEQLATLVASKVGALSNDRNGTTKTRASKKPMRQPRSRAAARAA